MEIVILTLLGVTILIVIFFGIRQELTSRQKSREVRRLQRNETQLEDKVNRLQREANDYWTALSRRYRAEQHWICENCGIDLQSRREFLDTHHIRGHAYNSPDDLKALCVECHSDQTQPVDHSFMKESPRYERFMQWRAPEDRGAVTLQEIKKALKEQVERESHILQLDPSGGRSSYIDYLCCDYDGSQIQLSIWIGENNMDIIATNLLIDNKFLKTFNKLKENRDKIAWLFPEEQILYNFQGNRHRIGIERSIDLKQRSNWNETATWARENLEKFFYIMSIHS